MKTYKLALLTLGMGISMMNITGSAWAGEALDESGQGAASIGGGALSAISAPLIIGAGAVTGDSKMIGNGFAAAAAAPSAVGVGLSEIGGGAIQAVTAGGRAVGSAGQEIVRVVHASGQKLADLNEQVYDNLSNWNPKDTTPAAQARIHQQTKTIPLVVRKQYVEMNEKVAQ